ncbi:tellurium resistance protein [Streptomyces sp. NPDC046909]|uniref:tellurium resistance protein n=1 Tax=Streptomyces sp. NPDC046909 TaxID=3155617 RepID=UPI0033FC66C7
MSDDGRPRGTIRLRPAARTDLVLTKAAPRARVAGRGVLQVNLNWSAATEADLDLGCLVACADGSGLAVQPLGNAFGSLTQWPYVALDQDDRTGASADGETVRVDLARREHFRQLLFYVYVYEGAVDFRRLGAVATVTAPSGGFRIALDDSPDGATGCAIALATPEPDGLAVRREVRWFTGTRRQSVQERMDRAYGFGFDWVWMTKD